jgi:LacI family transcriptional regulator
MRWVALMEACHELELRLHRVGPCNVPTVHAGFDSTVEVLAQRPTAVIAYNDLMAIGVMNGFIRGGLQVPEQVSIIGFDDILMARLTLPTLTTVAAPIRQMGQTAVSNVVAMINGAKRQSLEALVLPVTLKTRGSTAARRRLRTSLDGPARLAAPARER